MKSSYFLLQGIVIESTGLEVARKELVDVETEHHKNWVSSNQRQLFSCLCIINEKNQLLTFHSA